MADIVTEADARGIPQLLRTVSLHL